MSLSKQLRISVTALANFACRTGDLMPAGVVGPTAREGIRAHQKVQKLALENAVSITQLQDSDDTAKTKTNDLLDSDGKDALDPEDELSQPEGILSDQDQERHLEVEVALSCITTIDDQDIKLRGRVDIVDFRLHKLSEIKTTLVPAEYVPESQNAIHWAQLYLYGYIYLHDKPLNKSADSEVQLELLHVNIRADDTSSEIRTLNFEELSSFAHEALKTYVDWMRLVKNSQMQLQQSAKTLEFPYEKFRPGQRDMAAAVYRSSRDSSVLLCEAPTGIGKTISTLFPATKALGEGEIKQISYLTAKVAGRLTAMQTLKDMRASGLHINAVQIRAKLTTCFCSNGACERDDKGRCPMTLGFFDRLPAAREELFSKGIIDDKCLDEIAWEHQLCPFELALQMLPWVDVVIADFNYVFDPLVRLPHYSESRLDSVLLVDEAHNLVDRSRNMFSAELSRERCLDEAAACRTSHPTLARTYESLAKRMIEHARSLESPESVSESLNSSISKAASKVIEAIAGTVADGVPLSDSDSDMFRILCRYVAISDLFTDEHREITVQEKSGRRTEVVITLYCLDASLALAKQYKLFKSKVVFSATLRPAQFYRDTLGLPETTPQIQIESPFDVSRTCQSLVSWIDTRYKNRRNSVGKLVQLIKQLSEKKAGNYLVFFPSYAYLDIAYSAFTEQHSDVSVWRQTSEQTKEEQRELLQDLDVPGLRIGFAILGGVFGEGIDYKGDKLIGVIVVSTALPGFDIQTQLIADNYRRQGHDGYDFAYRYPGFTRVLQTVGRLIRSETDSGVIVLVDDRFEQAFYKRLYPASWRMQSPEHLDDLLISVEKFWSRLPDTVGQAIE